MGLVGRLELKRTRPREGRADKVPDRELIHRAHSFDVEGNVAHYSRRVLRPGRTNDQSTRPRNMSGHLDSLSLSLSFEVLNNWTDGRKRGACNIKLHNPHVSYSVLFLWGGFSFSFGSFLDISFWIYIYGLGFFLFLSFTMLRSVMFFSTVGVL